ncbi:MAG: HAD-IC family P-type ATPase, partial [archaeon]|nr:HAD-IC family P-type ATPase [archaeon]
IVEIADGDMVPADIRITQIMSSSLNVNQSLLTGEALDVNKELPAVGKDSLCQDKRNVVFAGTTVSRGKCRGVVIGVGLLTEKGKIQQGLSEQSEGKFPLKERLDAFGNQLTYAIGAICAVVWIINIPHFTDAAHGSLLRGAIYYFKISVSLAVAAIPEGLPAVVTTCLALGTRRMAAKNAIVTDLPAVETLGCTSVICSDKTGTLTTNQMSVQRFFVLDQANHIAEFEVEGSTFATTKADHGAFAVSAADSIPSLGLAAGASIRTANKLPQNIIRLAQISSLCNESSIAFEAAKNAYERVGQATEAAIKVLAEKLPVDDANVLRAADADRDRSSRVMALNNYWASKFTKCCTLEFHRERKSMSVLCREGNTHILFIKGAWDNVLARCSRALIGDQQVPLDAALRQRISAKSVEYCEGAHAYRCLALAYKTDNLDASLIQSASVDHFAKIETDAVFVGLVGIIDPPREEVKGAIEKCRLAGISVIVITGDNLNTATAICRKIGVFGPDEDVTGKAFTGKQFKEMSQPERDRVVLTARLFARVEPIDKQDLVKALHNNKKIVAMTGDGVNDAPALKEADIGIAMGSGTAVAKGAAKMVLADDNFTTIVSAVEEGRNIYNNTKQFIRYLITSNIGEVVAIFITAISGLPEVLLPVQLLWVNLVTDGLPAVALGFNQPEPDIMLQDPRPSNEPIVNGSTLFRYLFQGTYIGIATVLGMIWWFTMYHAGPQMNFDELFHWAQCDATIVGNKCHWFDDFSPNTMSLSVLVTIEMFQAINSLSERQSLFSHIHPFSNLYLLAAMSLSFGLHFVILYVPFLAGIFSVEPLNLEEWSVVVALACPVLLLDEIMKYFGRAAVHARIQSQPGNGKPKRD